MIAVEIERHCPCCHRDRRATRGPREEYFRCRECRIEEADYRARLPEDQAAECPRRKDRDGMTCPVCYGGAKP